MSIEKHKAFIDSLEPEKGLPEEMRMFPIMEGDRVSEIPWEMIAPHEPQAIANHGQTLERLAERGGLSVKEALYVIRGFRLFTEPQLWEAPLHQDERSLMLRERNWLLERCRRAESSQIPDLKERVKELVRWYAETEEMCRLDTCGCSFNLEVTCEFAQARALCAQR